MSSPRTYTKDEKRQAIIRASTIGATAASVELAIPSGTLSVWLHKARKGLFAHLDLGDLVLKSAQSADVHAAAESPAAEGSTPSPLPATEPHPLASPTGLPAETPSTKKASTKKPSSKKASSKKRSTKKASTKKRSTKTVSTSGPSTKKRHVRTVYTPSQRAQALELVAEVGMSEASRTLNISRFSLRQWKRKVELAAAGLGDSPTSGPALVDIEAQRDKEILDEWKRHPGLGPSQIRNQLRRGGIKVSTNTVRRVMEGDGYRPPKVRRDGHTQRYEAVRPNHLWHLDFVHQHINRANTFTFIIIDDHSRYVVGHGVHDAERADFVLDIFNQAVARHGRPEAVMTDRGSAFWSWKGVSRFTRLLTELGVDQVVAQHKEHNGKVEVFNANLSKELFMAHRFYDLREMERRLTSHLHWYNHRRTHHALGGLLVPADRYYGRVEEVQARIEAGKGATVHTDLLDLRDRALELFKVVSRDGRPEVWLMGEKILSTST